MIIGAQLYSLRTFLCNEEMVETTAKLCKKMGYRCMQFSGGKFDADALARISAQCGMPITLTHVDRNRLKTDLDGLIAEHKQIGCVNIGHGYLPREEHETEEALQKTCEFFNTVIEKLEKVGMKLYYHHHDFEFEKVGEETKLNYILRSCPKLQLTLDTHWAVRGGVNPVDLITKYADRLACVHLKDFAVENGKPKFAPVGSGNLNWEAILPALAQANVKYAFVEQDDAVYYPDPFEQMAKSMAFLQKYGY